MKISYELDTSEPQKCNVEKCSEELNALMRCKLELYPTLNIEIWLCKKHWKNILLNLLDKKIKGDLK